MTIGNVWLGSLQAKKLSTSVALSQAAFLIETTALSVLSVVERVMVVLSGQATEVLSIAVRPSGGTQYCGLLHYMSTSGYTSFVYRPDRPLFLYPGDQVVVEVKKTGTTGRVNGEVLVLY